jgi:hypothetical protein
MPQPTLSDVHVNRPLTDLSFAYQVELETVADKLFPNVPSQHKSDTYYTYPKGNWFRLQATKRAPGTESAGSGYEVSTDTFSCDVFALHKDVDDQIRSNADPVFNLDAEAARFVTQQLTLKREYDFAQTFFTTGIWTGSSTGSDITPSTKWDAASGDPIKDIRTQIDAMQGKTGIRPNKMVFGKRAWQVIMDNAAVIDRIKYSSSNDNPTNASQAAFAKILGLEQILIAGAVYNSAKEGAADSMGFMFTSDSALLCYAAPSPGLLTPSAGYTFSWNQYLAAANSLRISRFRMDKLRSDRIEGEMAYDMKQVAADLGCYFINVDA